MPLTVQECGRVLDKVFDARSDMHRGDSDRLIELISGFKRRTAAFAPNYLATYSNVAFILLGLALESLTGQNYEAVISSTIFEPFDLRHTTLTKPADREGAIPNVTNDWNSDLSTYNP